METIIKVLNSSFIIDRVILNNFTVFNEELNIEIDITSKIYGKKKLMFSNVIKLDINSNYYGCSDISSIIIEDMSELQWEGVYYKVMISEDVMTFYCKIIECVN